MKKRRKQSLHMVLVQLDRSPAEKRAYESSRDHVESIARRYGWQVMSAFEGKKIDYKSVIIAMPAVRTNLSQISGLLEGRFVRGVAGIDRENGVTRMSYYKVRLKTHLNEDFIRASAMASLRRDLKALGGKPFGASSDNEVSVVLPSRRLPKLMKRYVVG